GAGGGGGGGGGCFISGGRAPKNDRAGSSLNFEEDIDLDRARKHLPPRLQEGLQPRITGDLLSACLERLVNLVIDDLNKLCRVVDILKKADLLAAEQFVVGLSRLDERYEMGRVRGRQRKLELQDARDFLVAVSGHSITRPRVP